MQRRKQLQGGAVDLIEGPPHLEKEIHARIG